MITVLVSDENNDKDIVTTMMMRILTITVMQIYHIYDTFSVPHKGLNSMQPVLK